MGAIDLSKCISSREIRNKALEHGWNEQQCIDWFKKNVNANASDELLELLIDQVFHPQPWWDYHR